MSEKLYTLGETMLFSDKLENLDNFNLMFFNKLIIDRIHLFLVSDYHT